jgi:hypothetical protein
VTPEGLPRSLDDALEEIRAATADLIGAAKREDPSAFRSTLAERGDAIERFHAIVKRTRPSLTPHQVQLLDRATVALADQGDEAHALLSATMERARRELETFDKVAGAVRGYASQSNDPDGFDRSR